jgi:hypothetical protein
MKLKKLLLIAQSICLLLVFGNAAHAGIFFSDDLESGDFSHRENGAQWSGSNSGSGDSVSISSERAHSGSKSIRFHFAAGSSGDDAYAEQRFHLGRNMKDVYIRYYIYFPTNYEHRYVKPSNNKMIRLWGDGYDDRVKVGASAFSGSISKIKAEARTGGPWPYELMCSGGMDPLPNWMNMGQWILTSSMLGKWHCFEWHFKVDTGSGNGAIEFWVNGEKQFGLNQLSWDGAPCSPGYFKNGYLMGWANSGFDNDTDIYIDDVAFSDSYIGPDNGDISEDVPSPPKNLKVLN